MWTAHSLLTEYATVMALDISGLNWWRPKQLVRWSVRRPAMDNAHRDVHNTNTQYYAPPPHRS